MTQNTPFQAFCILVVSLLLFGCGQKESQSVESSASTNPNEPIPMPPEIRAYMEDKFYLPPEVYEALESGRITQDEVDARTAAGEFNHQFSFASIEDLPEGLKWENGMDLPDIGSPDAKKGGILYDYLPDFPRTLRMIGPDASTFFRSYIYTYNSLSSAGRHPNVTDISDTGFKYYPELASEWAIVKEKKTAYIRINPDARWSDGAPVTSNDYLYALYFLQSEHLQDPWFVNYYNRNYTNITKYDDYTISLTVPEAKPDLSTHLLGFSPLPMHFYGVLNENYVDDFQWRFQPTTGPYTIGEKDISKGRFIRMNRNNNWWAKDSKFMRNRFNVDTIHMTVIRDADKALESFIRGELDIFPLTLPTYWHDKLPNDHDIIESGYAHKYTFYNDIPRTSWGLWINTAQPLLNDVNIRLGINHAINYKKVIEEYHRGDYVRMNTITDGFDAFVNTDLEAKPFNVSKALEHFAKAGFKNRNDQGILTNAEGRELSFTLTSPYERTRDELTIIQEEAKRAGLDLNLEILDATAGFKKLDEKKHEIVFVGFAGQPRMYPPFYEYLHSAQAYDKPFLPDGSVNPDRKLRTSTNNIQSVADPDVDRLIERYRAAEDADEMIAIAHELQQFVHDNGSFIPAYVRPFFRVGSWRWIQWPEDFNVKIARDFRAYKVHWIDEEKKVTTLEAQKSGETFEPIIKTYDQYNVYK